MSPRRSASLMASPAGTARERWDPARRREQLLRVAEVVFAEHGYQGTSVADVATAAGVTRTLIYKYFKDTDEIYLACLRAARSELEERFATAALAHTQPEDQLRGGVSAYYEFMQTHGPLWDLLYGAGAAVAGPLAQEAAQLRYDTAEKIAQLIAAALPDLTDEATSAAAHVVSGSCEQLAKWWRRHPEVPLDTVVEYLMLTIWGGLQRLTNERPPTSRA